MNKVYNIFNAPKGQDSPHGEHVYEWEFLDDDGKLQKGKQDVFEKIQSYLPRVDYKAQIAKGELELNDSNTGVTKDYTGLPGNTVDLYKYLTYLSTIPKDQITKLMEQVNKAGEINLQNEQATNKTGDSGGQTPIGTVQNKSTNSESTPNINEGGVQ